MIRTLRTVLCIALAGALLPACGGGGATSSLPAGTPLRHKKNGSGSGSIQHVVLMIQENRSFNNLFATFPGVTGTTTGYKLVKKGKKYKKAKIALTQTPLYDKGNVTHLYKAWLVAYQNGAMDGFNLIKYVTNGKPEGKAPYVYVNPAQIAPYWTIAKQWGIADEMFQTQGSDSFTAHQELIRGGTFIDSTDSLIDPPSTSATWGCDSNPGATTTLIDTNLNVDYNGGPFPCSNQFPDYGSNGYQTLRDLLDAKSVSWKYYTPVFKKNTPSALWNAFDVIAPVRYGPEWTDGHIASPETTIFNDISSGSLPAMSWVIPDAQNSDHPGYSSGDNGPAWIASVVNAIGQSQYWDSTAVIIVWDDWGGFYDPVAPPLPRDDQGGPGFRVPMLVISPYVQVGTGSQGGYVSHTVYGFGSILRFVEDTFNLGRLGTTDSTCASIADMFNFNQSPRNFQQIPSSRSREYFLHQKPSGKPVDTD
ncbi:MAG TPA: alkaline phosphatase family protein [Candidatus Binatia bacterium]|nr:alkaline phosphatase family protein [Candidatus Binatia bacterium]